MTVVGRKPKADQLEYLGLSNINTAYWNLTPAQLIEKTIETKQGKLTDRGALVINTGKFTGRSPKDRFIVKDELTENTVWWGGINIAFSAEKFDALHRKMVNHLEGKDIYVKDAYACADPSYRLNLRLVSEYPWSSLFANNMFLRLKQEEINDFLPEWNILCVPSFEAQPAEDGTRQGNFAIINFSKKMILVGGTGYTGEIKKGIFSVLNFLLPHQHKVLSMHCSANVGQEADTALFFGLSGTGKTTLSADQNRKLIGDDEHGWTDSTVFNFEGGCYAKTIDLTEEKEPQIFRAIKFGALLENVIFKPNSSEIDYTDSAITENTRVSYPIHHIDNILEPSIGGVPKNIFFLTCDAFGVLPPISKLTPAQAMYHFISGYTAKVAGTETGITEPQTTFSACFGSPFLPLHPTVYATMLGEKLKNAPDTNVWLINTGWSAGGYGVGERIRLKYTRSMITAAMKGELNEVSYKQHAIFDLAMPQQCPNVPETLLDPKNTWKNADEYDENAVKLATAFVENFKKFADNASEEIVNAGPKITADAR